MKLIDNFKRKKSYVTDEEMARIEVICENDEEDWKAIHNYGAENLNRGYNTGVLMTAIASGAAWCVLNLYDYFRNRKNHSD